MKIVKCVSRPVDCWWFTVGKTYPVMFGEVDGIATHWIFDDEDPIDPWGFESETDLDITGAKFEIVN